jgi:hypothetical protein
MGEVACSVNFLALAAFWPGSAPLRACSRLALRQGKSSFRDGYARIAAMSGWTPMMFMTRVRL